MSMAGKHPIQNYTRHYGWLTRHYFVWLFCKEVGNEQAEKSKTGNDKNLRIFTQVFEEVLLTL